MKAFRIIMTVIMLAIVGIIGYNIVMKYMYPSQYEDYVEKYCKEYGIRESMVMAVINCESGFDPEAVSEKGATGLMQLTEPTFLHIQKMLGDEDTEFSVDAKDPETNIKYGTRYLKYLSEQFENDSVAVLAAYNAGLNNVKKWAGDDGKLDLEEIEYPETKQYVEKVLKTEENYKNMD